MEINRRGITRIVFVFKKVVVKIPNFSYSWSHFLKGLIANIDEGRCWRYNSGKYEKGKSHLICPVIWTSWGGWILVMQRADMKLWEQTVKEHYPEPDDCHDRAKYQEKLYKTWIEAGFGGDDKDDNYGYLKGKLVKVDYHNN